MPRPNALYSCRTRDEAAHPAQQRRRHTFLRGDVHRVIAVRRIDDERREQRRGVRVREARVAVGAPLHRRAHAVAVAEVDVVAHADLVAVVDDRRSRHGHEQRVHQLHLAAAAFHERRQTAPNADVDPHARIARVLAVHVVALFVGHHLERELVVVAQKDRPLAVRRESSGVCRMMSTIGVRSSLRSAMYMRGMTGKWNAM